MGDQFAGVRPQLLCAHGFRSDERHRLSEAVIHGRGPKWLGGIEQSNAGLAIDSNDGAGVYWRHCCTQ
jgi:hypothetical protein